MPRTARGRLTRLLPLCDFAVDVLIVCCVSVLRLLKEGADPNTLIPSGGSLLHLVRHKLITELNCEIIFHS